MNRSLVNRELSLFSYEILGRVGSGGAGAHDLLRMARHGRILDWAGESQYYTEPKRLAEYARTPVTITPLKSDPLLRLLVCDLVGEEVTRQSLTTLRDDIDDLRRRLDESEQSAADLPHRQKYLQLVLAFLRSFVDLHEQLVDDAERELAAPRQETRAG